MANYSTTDVKKIRDLTGAGMMDCKKALDEAEGDFDQAVEILRIKGAKDVGKRAGRTAANGLIAVSDGAMIELNCETDFVAKNEQFNELGNEIATLVAATKPTDLGELLTQTVKNGRSVQESIETSAASMGEKIELRRFVVLDGQLATYLHRKSPDLPPQVGVLVEFTGEDATTARFIGMQIAAMKPRYVSREEVPADILDSERRIAEQTAREEGRPEQALPKIINGRVESFFRDTVLLDQDYVQDSKLKVKAVLAAAGITVRGFAHFEVGQA